MGRRRAIDRDALLDAAERVVVQAGAARLTLDAVAAEAGISKASVLYDYKSKRALVQALIERRITNEQRLLESFVAAEPDRRDARIRGHLAATARSFSDEDRAVALNLCAALAQDADLRAPVEQLVRDSLADIEATSTQPRGALLAFLAIEGLMLLDRLGLHRFAASERDRIIAEIEWLIGQSPAAAQT